MKKFYLTTAIPYVNARPHIGHALEFVQADVIKRSHQLKGEDVLLLSGSDENSLKNVQAAEKEGMEVQEFVDKYAVYFQELAQKLNIDFDVFQKGSNQKTHFPASQKLWELCEKNGDIYKKSYEGIYCIGCEAFYTSDELNEKGECFEHPGKQLEKISEENYFFKLSKYQTQLIKLLESGEIKITPEFRKNETLSFLKEPLQDISISRSNERAKNWGVPVPGDDTQRMYVWFDALNIYQSGVGFGSDEKKYKKWWPADLHVIGKGISRFHTIYWPAFLLSAGLELPKEILIHGYITIDGQKMSKSIGNVIDPNTIIEKYGSDAFRYYFIREVPTLDDGDFSATRMNEVYNAHLGGGLGNLVARVTSMNEKYFQGKVENIFNVDVFKTKEIFSKYDQYIESYRFDEAVKAAWQLVDAANKYVDDNKPWALAKTDTEKLSMVLYNLLEAIRLCAVLLEPVIPMSAQKIYDILAISAQDARSRDWGVLQAGAIIKSGDILFPRIENK